MELIKHIFNTFNLFPTSKILRSLVCMKMLILPIKINSQPRSWKLF